MTKLLTIIYSILIKLETYRMAFQLYRDGIGNAEDMQALKKDSINLAVDFYREFKKRKI